MNELKSILIVGCGNMGGAMLAGWIAGGVDPARITVVDPAIEAAPAGTRLLREVPQERFDAVLLGIKPQMLGELAPSIRPAAGEGTVILSILAGVELDVLGAHFPESTARVRVMPNLAAALGKSPIALFAEGLDEGGRRAVAGLMEPLGQVEWLENEDQFHLVTALAGSGPAFVYRFIDALAGGSARLGMDRSQADRLALAMVEGAAALAASSSDSPGILADRVASPGGVTRAGLDVLDDDSALAKLMERTLRAAAERNAEMAREARTSQGEKG